MNTNKSFIARHPRLWGVIAILLVAIGYGLSPVLVKFSNELVSGPGQVAVRAAITAVLLLPYLLISKAEWKLVSLKATNKYWLLWYFFALPAGQILYVIAIIKGGIAAGPAALFYLNASKVVGTFLIKRLIDKSEMSLGRIAVIVLAIAAMAIFAWPNPLTFTLPMLAAIGTGAIEAVSSMAMGKLSKKDNRYVLAFSRYGISAILLVLVLPLIGQPISFQASIGMVAILIAIGTFFLSGLSQAFIGKLELDAYQLIDEDLANIIVTTELIWGVIFSVWLINNKVNSYQIIGMALLLIPSAIAGYMAYLKKHEKVDT